MSEHEEVPRIDFLLTPRQRRHRVITALLLIAILTMIVIGVTNPFFNLRRHGHITAVVRKALAAKGIMIMGYWTICFIMALGLIVIAWLEYREIQRKLLLVRRDVWREIARRTGSPGDSPKK